MEPKQKAILLTVGNIRVKEYDLQNVTLEREEEVLNPKDGTTSNRWRFKGYFPTIARALGFAVRKELLVDRKASPDLNSYLKLVVDSNQKVMKAIERM